MPDRQPEPSVLVTGASGHVDANLVRRLLDDGVRVRVLLRRESTNEALDGLDVEHAYADILDLDAPRSAVEGCRGLYHCAAKISTIDGNRAHRRDIFECNVIGTRNVLQAARDARAGRVVVTGYFSAVGHDLYAPPGRPSGARACRSRACRGMIAARPPTRVPKGSVRPARAGRTRVRRSLRVPARPAQLRAFQWTRSP